MYKTATRKRQRHSDYDISGDLARIKEALNDTALDMKNKASDMLTHSWENAKEKSADIHDSVGNFAKERPVMTLGFTFLAGTLIGFLLRHK